MSSLTIFGFAAMENPRREGLTYTFDVQLWLNGTQTLIAALRFFNGDGLRFKDMDTYVIAAHVRLTIVIIMC